MAIAQSKIEQWKQHTTAGNIDYQQNDIKGAIQSYSQAKRIALSLFDNSLNLSDIVPILIISHQNLSFAYKQKKDLINAHKELVKIHNVLIDLLKSSHQHSREMLEALHLGIGNTQIELFKFLKEYPMMFDSYLRYNKETLH